MAALEVAIPVDLLLLGWPLSPEIKDEQNHVSKLKTKKGKTRSKLTRVKLLNTRLPPTKGQGRTGGVPGVPRLARKGLTGEDGEYGFGRFTLKDQAGVSTEKIGRAVTGVWGVNGFPNPARRLDGPELTTARIGERTGTAGDAAGMSVGEAITTSSGIERERGAAETRPLT
ncbi:hypothetical protein MJO29_006940 [Puccinia striiformis f. sp. tritici]|nr:hypothetical protein MJO29_006940 [Puccinia striiformis f. sp. tritici]